MKSMRFYFVMSYLIVSGFSIVIALFGIMSPAQAQETPEWRVPAILQPRNNIYTVEVTGSFINRIVTPIKTPKLSTDKKTLSITFKDESFQLPIKDKKAVPGIVLNADGVHGGQMFFTKESEVNVIKQDGLSAFVKSTNEIKLEKTDDNTYILQDNDKLNLAIHANKIKAELLMQPTSSPQDNNPIKLMQKWGATGSAIKYHLQDMAIKEGGKSKINVLFFPKKNAGKPIEVASMDVDKKPNEHGLWGRVALPKVAWDWGNTPLIAVALVTDASGGSIIKVDNILVSSKWKGIILGVLVVFIFLFVIAILKPTSKWEEKRKDHYEKEEYKSKLFKKFFRFLLSFAITPIGRYSISLVQILFWTLVIIFAFVYVAWTRAEFMNITAQMLTLLGISGTTAITAKAVAMARVSDIPDEYMKDVTEDRIPRLKDLISIGDVPSIFKFQILAFTLLAGVQVLRQLWQTGNFPELEENLLVLMGISSGAYVANEIATENVWKKLSDLIAEIKDKKREMEIAKNEKAKLVKELDDLDKKKETLNSEMDTKKDAAGNIDPNDPDVVSIKKGLENLDKDIKEKQKEQDRKTALFETIEIEIQPKKDEIERKLQDIFTEGGFKEDSTKTNAARTSP